jgi:uncharacterized lipoprotein YehR (DUF1307 family)
MKTNRILRFQLIALLIVAVTSLAGCGPREESKRREGIDVIPVVSTSQIATNIANAVYYQVVVQDRGI